MTEKEIAVVNRNKQLAEKVIKNLQSRNFEAYYCSNAEDAVKKALELMPEKSSVSWGGSVSISECGLTDAIKAGSYNVIDRDMAKDAAERYELMRRALHSDVFLTSFNALSEDGVAYNVDGVGNRVAAIAFGPKIVIAIVGMNKIVKSADDAKVRARTIAGPLNAHRCAANPFMTGPQKTPCIINGSCGDCRSADCICSYVVETRMSKPAGRIKVILVEQSLGL